MGHYYQQTETGVIPMHFVECKKKRNDDPPRLRHTRITDVQKWWGEGRTVVPSVTTVQNVLDKAALTNWKIDQHLEQAWHLARESKLLESFPDYVKEIKRLTELQMDIAPNAGSDLHKIMHECTENAYKIHELSEHDLMLFQNIDSMIRAETGHDPIDWGCEKNFVSESGYGGQVDLVVSEAWIIDYKTKQTAAKFKPGKMAYDDHSMQLAAYRKGLGLPKARCANVFVCLEDGQIDFHEHKEEELDKGWEVFKRTLEIWQIRNGWHER